MDPEFRYARTSDGVEIAFFALGQGPPLVVLPYLPMSHIEREWRIAALRQWVGWFAGHRMLVRYDSRLTGLSGGAAADLSLESHLLDLDAVLDAVGIQQADLLAASFAGPIALAYAARRPGRVRKLALWTTHASHDEVVATMGGEAAAQSEAIEQLGSRNMDMFLRAWIHRAVGWPEGEAADSMFNLSRSTMSPELFPTALRAYRRFDATADLPAIAAPTLVMHRRGFPGSSIDVARGLASRIPGARLTVIEGESIAPFVGNGTEILMAIDQFLGTEGIVAPRLPLPGSAGSDVRTILFTDVEGHTAMTQRFGDARAREFLRAHERVTREEIATFEGVEVKAMGDGFMVSFASAQRALECAVSMQRRFERMFADGSLPARVRMGLNAGEPIAEDGDLFGRAVIAAARIAEVARGGEILVANVVRELVAGNEAVGFDDRGVVPLKGFDGEFHVFAVRW